MPANCFRSLDISARTVTTRVESPYSLYLVLQLKARYEGIPTPVYGLQEVHHLQ
jgi:hypothetical protein